DEVRDPGARRAEVRRAVARRAVPSGIPGAPAGRHRAALHRRVRRGEAHRRLPLPRVRHGAVPLGHQVRLALRLAELLVPAGRRPGRPARGPGAGHGAGRGPLRALPLAPRPRLLRRGLRHADRRPLLHQLDLADVRAGQL
ncbi:MAG: Peptide-methionine (R)-S-oxide reductase MsrB, partial [uncultured Corynebacteriales bacterium]